MPRDKTGHFYYSYFPAIFRGDTRRINFKQRGAYQDLINEYMLTRSPLCDNDEAMASIIGCDLTTWINELKNPLVSYFKPRDGFWFHSFCDEVLAGDHARITKSRSNGALGGRPSNSKIKEINPPVTNTKPITKLTRTNINRTEYKKQESLFAAGGEEPPSAPPKNKIVFDYQQKKFSGYDYLMEAWGEAYPAVDIEGEIKKAAAWLIANPNEKRSNYARFLNTWLSKEQDAGGKRPGSRARPESTQNPKEAAEAQLKRMQEKGLI